MANYNLVSGATFNPFTYDELMKPILRSDEMHQLVEDAETLLAELEADIERKISQTNDPISFRQLTLYRQKLQSVRDDLYRYGLRPNSRTLANQLKRDYASSVKSVQDAFNAKSTAITNEMNARLKGYVFERSAEDESVDAYLNNPLLQHKSANYIEGMARVKDAATALLKRLIHSYKTGNIDSYTKYLLTDLGYDPSEVHQAILDVSEALQGRGGVKGNAILRGILEREMHTSGVDTWTNQAALMDYFNRISDALFNAVGGSDLKTFDDFGAREALSHANRMAEIDHQYNLNNSGKEDNLKGDNLANLIKNLEMPNEDYIDENTKEGKKVVASISEVLPKLGIGTGGKFAVKARVLYRDLKGKIHRNPTFWGTHRVYFDKKTGLLLSLSEYIKQNDKFAINRFHSNELYISHEGDYYVYRYKDKGEWKKIKYKSIEQASARAKQDDKKEIEWHLKQEYKEIQKTLENIGINFNYVAKNLGRPTAVQIYNLVNTKMLLFSDDKEKRALTGNTKSQLANVIPIDFGESDNASILKRLTTELSIGKSGDRLRIYEIKGVKGKSGELSISSKEIKRSDLYVKNKKDSQGNSKESLRSSVNMYLSPNPNNPGVILKTATNNLYFIKGEDLGPSFMNAYTNSSAALLAQLTKQILEAEYGPEAKNTESYLKAHNTVELYGGAFLREALISLGLEYEKAKEKLLLTSESQLN